MPMDEDDKKSKLHNYTAETLHNEIERFWKRSLFFWGFIAAAFVAYGVLIDKHDKDVPLAISCFGLVCSVAWTLANRGSKYWQYHCEQKLKSVESAALGRAIFAEDIVNNDRELWGGKRYSVTRLTIALSDFVVLVWLALAFKASPAAQGKPWNCTSIVAVGVTAIYLVALFVGGRSKPPQ